uniref:Uncharacterized protein n=1 Tax=Cacopsylla melanoneura TaxID=428564 RepID=A0A8D8LS38_9HEMI
MEVHLEVGCNTRKIFGSLDRMVDFHQNKCQQSVLYYNCKHRVAVTVLCFAIFLVLFVQYYTKGLGFLVGQLGWVSHLLDLLCCHAQYSICLLCHSVRLFFVFPCFSLYQCVYVYNHCQV